MGERAARYMSYRRKPEKPESAGEAKALDRLQAEAIEAGATLHSEGRGGLPSSVVLGVLRRDSYQCKKCGGKEDLTMHHKADILASDYLRRLKKFQGALTLKIWSRSARNVTTPFTRKPAKKVGILTRNNQR